MTQKTTQFRHSSRTAGLLSVLAINLLLFASMAEVALRLFPRSIPLEALAYFKPGNRSKIAQARKIPNYLDSIRIEDDGPVELYQRAPGVVVEESNVDLDQTFSNRMDRLGFCNPETMAFDSPADIDVVVLGDSFTYCTAVAAEDTWPALLSGGTGRSFYNMGLIGHGPEDYLRLLRHHRASLTPRMVVFAYYAGNDLRDNHRYYEELFGEPAGPKYSEGPTIDTSSPLAQSYLYSMLHFVAARSGEWIGDSWERGVRAMQGPQPANQTDFRYTYRDSAGQRHPFNLHNRDTDEIRYARKLERNPRMLESLGLSLDRFAEDAREHNYQPVVVFIPSAYHVLPDVAFSDPEVGAEAVAFMEIQEQVLAREAAARGIPFIDLSPRLREVMSSGLTAGNVLYNPTNRHLSPRGNEVIAAYLAERLAPYLPPSRQGR